MIQVRQPEYPPADLWRFPSHADGFPCRSKGLGHRLTEKMSPRRLADVLNKPSGMFHKRNLTKVGKKLTWSGFYSNVFLTARLWHR